MHFFEDSFSPLSFILNGSAISASALSWVGPWDSPSPAPSPSSGSCFLEPPALICPESSTVAGRGGLLLHEPSTPWHQCRVPELNHGFSPYRTGDQETTTRGIPVYSRLTGFKKRVICSWTLHKYFFFCSCRSSKLQIRQQRCCWCSLMGSQGNRKSPESSPSFANGMDSMASSHWWTCFVMFSLFLNRPPSSVLLTMPGSSRDLHLPLCFVNPCFPTCFFIMYNWSNLHPNK